MAARFVRLAIAGFKSFAEPATVEILPGLTGIVGPNGCGKSNVAEALRWAMGEANPRSLRGAEMDDVIFAGTSTRPSRNLAEVSLTLEDAERAFPPPFAGQPEVQVTRRIERGVGSAYRVNGKEARARDVQTLFADLASGARSSAMVSQGRVSSLVTSRPEDRRQVLEEAAGITGLHARRAEAETKLRAAEANLERAEERRALLDRQLAGLRVQAKQAARYRTLSTTVGEAEAALLSLQAARAAAIQAEAVTHLSGAQADADRAAAASVAAAAASEEARHAVPALRHAEAEARTALERARLAQEGVQAAMQRAEAALAAARQRREQVARDLAYAGQLQRDSAAADERLAQEAARLAAEEDAHPAEAAAAQGAADQAAKALHAAEHSATAATNRAAELTAGAQALSQVLEAAELRARRATEALARLQADRARAEHTLVDPARVAAAGTEATHAEAELTRSRTQLEAAEAARAQSGPRAAAARDAHSQADAARMRLAAETAALAEVLAVGDGERWPPMVDRLQVPLGLEAALGAALGEELAAATDPAAARHWRDLPPLPAGPLSRLDRPLLDQVRAPFALARALSGIGLVDTDAQGDAAQPTLAPGQSLVSRAGAVWRWDGYTVRAGTATAAAVRLQQRNRLAGLAAQLQAAEAAAATAREARAEAETAERAAIAAEQQARATRREAEQRADRARAAAAALQAQASQAQLRLADLDERIQALDPEVAETTSALGQAQRERDAAPDLTLLRAEAGRTRAALAEARSRDTAAHRQLDALLRAQPARQARLATIARERQDRSLRAQDAASRVTDLAARAAEAERDYQDLQQAPESAAREKAHAAQALAAAQAAHAQSSADLGAAEQHAEAQGARARAAEQALYTTREAVVRAESARDQARQAWEVAQDRVAERAGALPALPPAPGDLSAPAEDRARARWQRLARERDEMGPVNLRAELEAAALETEIAGIERDRDELATAIAKLRGGIGHLNREGRERLAAVFQQVDQQFQALFTRMFGGGRAHLALVGSDDPLQAGLEIYAQPPGKKLATLSLLSGGEQALTALSLIFAVFRCNPAPLCVLDEVDAPLDDANVERFCSLLADMVAETGTRFLVVTHHQLTMARMDRLYGVTMQERGVSSLLSVDLSAAVGMVEAMAAE